MFTHGFDTHTHSQVTPTDGAVLSVPALVALALAVLAGPVFDAERVADALVAAGPGPAFLAAAGSAHAYAMGATVHRANLCKQGDTFGSHTTFVGIVFFAF